MDSPQHHPFGPSKLERFFPQTGGCGALIEAPQIDLAKAEQGTLNHLAISTGDLSVLEGDALMEALVKAARNFLEFESLRLDGEEFHELRVEMPGVLFGTLDYVKFNKEKTKAILIDFKFGSWKPKWDRSSSTKNLQILAYCSSLFSDPKFPRLSRIFAIIYHVQSNTAYRHTYAQRYNYKYHNLIAGIVANAQRAQTNPRPEDFTPSPVICGFCARLNCPARIELARSLVAAWTGEPVMLPHLKLTSLSLQELGALKRLTNALKAFCTATDDEAKRRAIDEGALIPGYELRERSGKRTITGPNIQLAASVIQEVWRTLYPSIELPLKDILSMLVEIGVGDIEKHIARYAPRGTVLRTQKLISEALAEAKLVEAMPQYILAAIKQ
jgi:hypothetical protein